MLKQLIRKVIIAHTGALHRQRGQSLIIFTFAFLGLIAMLGVALDLGLVYVEQVRVGRTTDAATLAGVVELPFEEDAMRRAIEYIELNGYQPGVDTEIVVRGCVDTLETTSPHNPDPLNPYPAGNVSEMGPGATITTTNEVTGALVIQYITAEEPVAIFMIDTLSHQPQDGGCDPANGLYGNANKLQINGFVNVNMNFMQFFGFGEVPVQDTATAENITNLDVVVVFDVSGSMEFETNCYDCWVRTDPNNPNFPNNGYFNPLPYNARWADQNNDGTPDVNQSIPESMLCNQAPQPVTDGANRYFVHEAELYSREVGNWSLDVRSQGQGFWVLQRGSRNRNNNNIPYTDENNLYHGNQAGSPANQSSNVCNPAVPGIQCIVPKSSGPADNVCADDAGIPNNGSDLIADCSAYIAAHPFPTYTQDNINNIPKLQGAAYNLECWTGTCWSEFSSTDSTRPNQALVPYVEYDFTPDWSGNTHIWIRARGGGDQAKKWRGLAPVGGSQWIAWDNRVYWQVGTNDYSSGSPLFTQINSVQENSVASSINSGPNSPAGGADWQDNRIKNEQWQWIKLGSVGTTANAMHVLRIYQGSAGYKIDKIVFTNDSSSSPPAVLSQNGGRGPAATPGSATRESCNKCNPAFGYTVSQPDCTCSINSTEVNSAGYGSGGNSCTIVIQPNTNQLRDHLYSGTEPIRSAQEAVKNFVKRLNPQFDQVGIVPFSNGFGNPEGVPSTASYGPRRTKLQCIRDATVNLGNPRQCYDPSFGTPISYTLVLEALERQWPQGGTNIAGGLREGLEELGVDAAGNPETVNSDCSTGVNDGEACDRRGAARKVLILLTDGAPNGNPGSCAPGGGRPDLWNGDVGTNDDNFECAVFYGKEAADAGVIVYSIGLGAGAERDLLTAIAEGRDPHTTSGASEEFLFDARGGRYFNAAKPSDLDGIFSVILSNIYVRIVG